MATKEKINLEGCLLKQYILTIYILLDIFKLVCSIAVYFYKSCSILASPKGESKYK